MFWTLMDPPAALSSQQHDILHHRMATSDQIKTALLTEHFRYTPLVGLRSGCQAVMQC